MEDDTTYTYPYEEQEEQKPERSLKIIFIIVIAVLFVFAILLGVLIAIKNTKKPESETTTASTVTETTTTLAPVVQEPTYKAGPYSVNTEGFSLIFRKDHSKTAEAILEIADKTKLQITEIFCDTTLGENSDEKYWGKAEYLGHTGWLNMKYLKKEYSDNVVLPTDATTTAENTTAAENTTVNSTQPTDTSTTKAPESTTVAQSKYSVGDYKVSTGGSTLTFRKEASRTGEVILSINDGTAVTVLEVVDTKDSQDVYRYWGKISYQGYTGYVSMAYLAK